MTFEANFNELRQVLNVSTYDKVIGTDIRKKLKQINQYINNFS